MGALPMTDLTVTLAAPFKLNVVESLSVTWANIASNTAPSSACRLILWNLTGSKATFPVDAPSTLSNSGRISCVLHVHTPARLGKRLSMGPSAATTPPELRVICMADWTTLIFHDSDQTSGLVKKHQASES
ncbi:hypothetical protein M404DRAFT_1000567 [Pisolithus tinctorius Marx 270]|uniref:Uncharacterized protein n=1 Tax=Pisolithus tinctorius Marx 270 TaxID=870435 RepID=A0A0C3PA61_PISTI|nr:hypothetical protein M404DRAFT_1000567 [Pisolithus tinctorius Marx 270]